MPRPAFNQSSSNSLSNASMSMSASRASKPRLYAAWNRPWASGLRAPSPKRPESPTEVLDLRERDRIDAHLARGDTGARELGDPMSERSDEIAELLRGQ